MKWMRKNSKRLMTVNKLCKSRSKSGFLIHGGSKTLAFAKCHENAEYCFPFNQISKDLMSTLMRFLQIP